MEISDADQAKCLLVHGVTLEEYIEMKVREVVNETLATMNNHTHATPMGPTTPAISCTPTYQICDSDDDPNMSWIGSGRKKDENSWF